MIDVGELSRELDPLLPLSAEDRLLYVDCQCQIHPGGADAKSLLSRTFARNATPDRTITRLITGHSGSGKTTELKQVSRQLGEGQHGRSVFVSFLFAERYLDLEDITPEELLFQIVRQLAADLSEQGMKLHKHKIGTFFTALWEQARSARLTSIDMNANPFALGFTLKDVPGERQEFRRMLRSRLPTVYEIVNGSLLPDARKFLAKRGYNDLLLVVDELDRIPRKSLSQQETTNHEHLFIEHAHKFKDVDCSLLLTIPVELAYSVAAGRLTGLYGAQAHTVSVVPIRDKDDRELEQGELSLIEILGRRAMKASRSPHATADECVAEIFEHRDLLLRFVRLSGGHVRSLLASLAQLLNYVDELPIDMATIDRFQTQATAALVRGLNARHLEILRQVCDDKHKTDDPLFFDLLRNQHVFAYESEHGPDWYDVNPLLRDVVR